MGGDWCWIAAISTMMQSLGDHKMCGPTYLSCSSLMDRCPETRESRDASRPVGQVQGEEAAVG